jgi:hypothetical protein
VAPLASPIYYDEAGMNTYICRYCRQPSDPGYPYPADSADVNQVCGYDLPSGVWLHLSIWPVELGKQLTGVA